MPQFKIGDKVRRNDWSDDEADGNQVKLGDWGLIEDYTDGDPYDYLVSFESRGTWYIKKECLELFEPETQESKEKKVIAKIKYLNEKYAKSRTVPTQVVDAEQRELGARVASVRREATRVTITPDSLYRAAILDGNAIRSETARLRGIDSIYESLYRAGVFDEFTTNIGTERVRR